MNRDSHLPPPEVCDWLLSQEWSKPSTVHVRSKYHKGHINDCCETSAAIGRDETIDLLLPSFGLQVLREDAVARRQAIEEKRQHWEADELLRIKQREAQRLCEISHQTCCPPEVES